MFYCLRAVKNGNVKRTHVKKVVEMGVRMCGVGGTLETTMRKGNGAPTG